MIGAPRRRLQGRLRPIRPWAPILGSVVTLGAWAAVAHNSGSGWVQALGAMLGATLLVGLVMPAFVVRRAFVEVVRAPSDGSAGGLVELVCTATTRVRIRPLEPTGPDSLVGPARAGSVHPGEARLTPAAVTTPGGGTEGVVTLAPERRGVHTVVRCEVASAAPFGLMWWGRRTALLLPAELVIAPHEGAAEPVPPAPAPAPGDTPARVPAVIGEPRGIRAYEPGDNRRWVHWPATAHLGTLMVREMESPVAEPALVDVRLPSDPAGADAVAGRALGTVGALLDRGAAVRLRTVQADGPAEGPVTSRRDAGRRLGRAVASGSVGIGDARSGPWGAGSPGADGGVTVSWPR